MSFPALAALLRNDARRLARDRFLVGTAAYIVAVSIALRWVLPWAARALRARSGFELEPHYPVVVSYLVGILGAVMVGTIGGFLLIEAREERSLRALLVSPLPLRLYAAGGSAVLVVAAAGVILVEGAIVGLALPPWPAFVPIALVAGLAAPLGALFLAVFARNKVEAFALMKFVSLGALIPVAAAFLPQPWQYLACLFPPFWAVKAWWIAAAGGGGWGWWLAGGALTSAAALALLLRRFARVARSG